MNLDLALTTFDTSEIADLLTNAVSLFQAFLLG
jgi:hypothetical protein